MTTPFLTGLAAMVAAEQADQSAGRAQPCGKVCDDGCHGNLTCIRSTHPHDPNAHLGPTKPQGDVTPHAAYTDIDGQPTLVQWACLPDHHDGLTAETRRERQAALAAEERRARTKDLFDTLDPDYLKDLLHARGDL